MPTAGGPGPTRSRCSTNAGTYRARRPPSCSAQPQPRCAAPDARRRDHRHPATQRAADPPQRPTDVGTRRRDHGHRRPYTSSPPCPPRIPPVPRSRSPTASTSIQPAFWGPAAHDDRRHRRTRRTARRGRHLAARPRRRRLPPPRHPPRHHRVRRPRRSPPLAPHRYRPLPGLTRHGRRRHRRRHRRQRRRADHLPDRHRRWILTMAALQRRSPLAPPD